MTLLGPTGAVIGGERECRGCGCTDSRACVDGCAWVLLDVDQPTGICSRCAVDASWDVRWLACVGFDVEEAA